MVSAMFIENDLTLSQKIASLNWWLILLICCVASVGIASLYSAAGGSMEPWASRQLMRFGVGLVGMMVIALVNIKWWYRLTWPLYFVGLILLLIVEIKGHVGMGAQRWIDLGFMQLQPSELMKIAVVMALARHFHGANPEQARHLSFLIVPALVIIAPVALVLLQPDLGTSLMIIMAGAGMVFMAGAPIWLFVAAIILVGISIPVVWQFLHAYQKQRIMTFLDPESDPLGAGYHIIQSKIAIGSGGIEGKGFLQGTQSHLNFLPEKQTDFIFTLWVEEWGLLGGLGLLGVFLLIFISALRTSLKCKHNFGKYLALGIGLNFSLYVFINISMVMGLIPVVGAPLPLVSYGGTSMLAALIGFGLMMSCSIYRHSKVTR
ncbi:MAG: rod shape-determining protein RodA [Alphaproteobacteria bacterium]|nr:MAG: rod shape-determining protein RodA [Alphaproteobacteria bacterium]